MLAPGCSPPRNPQPLLKGEGGNPQPLLETSPNPQPLLEGSPATLECLCYPVPVSTTLLEAITGAKLPYPMVDSLQRITTLYEALNDVSWHSAASSLHLGLCPRFCTSLGCMGRCSLTPASRDSNHVMLEPLVIDTPRHAARLDSTHRHASIRLDTPAFESLLCSCISMTRSWGELKLQFTGLSKCPAFIDRFASSIDRCSRV